MGLSILSKNTIDEIKTFESIASTALNAKLFFLMTEWATNSSRFIEVNLKKYAGEENIEQGILIDIFTINEQIEQKDILNIQIDDELYYKLAGTDNTPYELCYRFSLAYLKLCPEHIISMHEEFYFTLQDMLDIEKNGGFYENWSVKMDRE